MNDEVFTTEPADVQEVLYRVSYIGEQSKPVRGLAFATHPAMLPPARAAMHLDHDDDVVPPETAVVAMAEMTTLLHVTHEMASKLFANPVQRPFFRLRILRKLRGANVIRGEFVVERDSAAGLLDRIEEALGPTSDARPIVARLRRETLPGSVPR